MINIQQVPACHPQEPLCAGAGIRFHPGGPAQRHQLPARQPEHTRLQSQDRSARPAA